MGMPPISNVKAALNQMGQDIQRNANGNADAYARQMYETNPEFRALADQVQGMTPAQAYSQVLGVPFDMIKRFIPF